MQNGFPGIFNVGFLPLQWQAHMQILERIQYWLLSWHKESSYAKYIICEAFSHNRSIHFSFLPHARRLLLWVSPTLFLGCFRHGRVSFMSVLLAQTLLHPRQMVVSSVQVFNAFEWELSLRKGLFITSFLAASSFPSTFVVSIYFTYVC